MGESTKDGSQCQDDRTDQSDNETNQGDFI